MKKWLILAGILVVVATLVTVGILKGKGSSGLGGGRGKGVQMAKVTPRNVIQSVTASGRVEPRLKVNISSNVMGEIQSIYVKEGYVVKPGDPLLDLDPARYQSEVDRLEANLRVTQLEAERAEVSLRDAEVRARRQESLFRENLVSADTVESARLALANAQVNLRSTREGVSQAQAALARARDDLEQTRFTSPQAGIVTTINAEVGEQVIVGTMNNPGTVIMEIADLSELLVEANVDETEVVSVQVGQEAAVRVDAIADLTFEGEVAEVPERAVQSGNVATFPVKVRFSNPDPRLKPGMTARVAIATEEKENAPSVPIQAVVYRDPEEIGEKKPENPTGPAAPGDEGVQVVYVVEDGKAVPRKVRTGISDDLYVELAEGPPVGTTVVSGPYRILRNLKKDERVREEKEKKGKGEEPEGESGAEGGAVEVEVDG